MMRKDWTLLTIVAADEHPLQPVQLQKSLFLISRNLPHYLLGSDQFYSFSQTCSAITPQRRHLA